MEDVETPKNEDEGQTRKSSEDSSTTPAIKSKYRVSYMEIVGCFISVIVKFISIIVTIFLAEEYYRNGHIYYFALTIICMSTCIITSILIIYIYQEEIKQKSSEPKPWYDFIFSIIVMPLFFRYYQSLVYSILCKKAERNSKTDEQKYYYTLLLKEDSNVALVRIFECFLEATPQKILQITIFLINNDPLRASQMLSILSSFTSITWCMASYHRSIRFVQGDKKTINCAGSIVQCVWHFCITVSRITSICICLTVFPSCVLIAGVVHVFIMFLWIHLSNKSPFCSNTSIHSLIFSLLLSFVYIFMFLAYRDGKTRNQYLFYYSICGLENLAAAIIFVMYYPENIFHVHTSIFLFFISLTFFVAGIFFMIVYYKCCHPNITRRRELRSTSM